MFYRNGKIDWLTLIPMAFWIGCMIISGAKLLQTDNDIDVIDWLDIVNSNTFSTFLSMIICMAYQFFSVKSTNNQEDSGLSRKWIGWTILLTILYGIIAVINACRYNIYTTVLMTMTSAVYVFLFFKYMRAR